MLIHGKAALTAQNLTLFVLRRAVGLSAQKVRADRSTRPRKRCGFPLCRAAVDPHLRRQRSVVTADRWTGLRETSGISLAVRPPYFNVG